MLPSVAITANNHGLGLVVDFNNVLGSSASASSVDQTSRKPKAGSNQDNLHQDALLKNTCHQQKIHGARNKYTEPDTNVWSLK